MDYKKEELKEYFDDYIESNKDLINEQKEIDPSGNDWFHDLHHWAFNMDYYIIGTYQAKQWLGDMAFDVIGFIKQYEEDNFGEVYTDLSNPEKVVNMYVYIIGEEIVSDYLNESEEVA